MIDTCQCGKLLSGASLAAMEVYHHGYLISQPHFRDQQGQFSALSTLPTFFFSRYAEPTSSGLGVTERVSCKERRTEKKRQKKMKERTNQMCKMKTKLLMSKRMCKNVDQGFNESWQSTSHAFPRWNDPLTQQKSGHLFPSLQSQMVQCRPS